MKSISVLIPTFNDRCDNLVSELVRQASTLGICYEIIVADDGSTDTAVIEANRNICKLPGCRLIERHENAGRTAIRNFLVTQAKYPWLLFIDSDMVVCRTDFMERYALSETETIAYGGVVIGEARKGNLRSIYEKAHEQEHTAEKRRLSPYQDFHTANFMVRRDIMIENPFDMRYRHYGYEDVAFGKQMKQKGIVIHHIDNPLSFEVFESNADFISKTEEGLRTLCHFRDELSDYSRLIRKAEHLPRLPILWWHKLFGNWERRNLTGPHPSLAVFNLYRLGYFVTRIQSASTQPLSTF